MAGPQRALTAVMYVQMGQFGGPRVREWVDGKFYADFVICRRVRKWVGGELYVYPVMCHRVRERVDDKFYADFVMFNLKNRALWVEMESS